MNFQDIYFLKQYQINPTKGFYFHKVKLYEIFSISAKFDTVTGGRKKLFKKENKQRYSSQHKVTSNWGLQ